MNPWFHGLLEGHEGAGAVAIYRIIMTIFIIFSLFAGLGNIGLVLHEGSQIAFPIISLMILGLLVFCLFMVKSYKTDGLDPKYKKATLILILFVFVLDVAATMIFAHTLDSKASAPPPPATFPPTTEAPKTDAPTEPLTTVNPSDHPSDAPSNGTTGPPVNMSMHGAAVGSTAFERWRNAQIERQLNEANTLRLQGRISEAQRMLQRVSTLMGNPASTEPPSRPHLRVAKHAGNGKPAQRPANGAHQYVVGSAEQEQRP